jgi:L-lactate dehydrogenase complex protein LldG
MSAAREEILRRVRQALRDVPADERPEDVQVLREYRRERDDPRDVDIERFSDRVRDYHADVRRVRDADVAQALRDACGQFELRRVVVPAALPEGWRPEGVEVVEDHQLEPPELDQIDGAITGCAAAIAETGTIVLDGGDTSGRRAITLVPDHHICLIRSDQVHAGVPEAIAAVAAAVIDRHAPITFISGPSASSDIELSRVEGVHGPRHLLALIVDGPGPVRPGT